MGSLLEGSHNWVTLSGFSVGGFQQWANTDMG